MQESEAKTHLTVYYRVGCHLCDEMTALLCEFQDELMFTFELVDIDADAELRVRFNADVPVVAWGKQILFWHFFDEAILRQALQHG
ncbi:glutaredoxin family protein [Thiothrix litoralis]|uniref:Glutaredoxin family protein n=1 Tax=Thiothrix litoralis TaxID=2891210 RepID=A0ABX7X529_9GAMM|nr:glutaredoxin family protein [Thiothrix litoralis]QTR48225.1 glutaredoxin family protein [Thiothrix litoralis]